MNIDQLTTKAKYYEKLTRQYKEAQDFLQALRCTNPKIPLEELPGRIGFDDYSEIQISTPAILNHKSTTSRLVFRVNLSKDLGMDMVNGEITDLLIQRVQERLTIIEDELSQVFDGLEDN